MAFEARYTVAGTQDAIVSALAARGLRRSLSLDRRCVVQWAPFSKLKWKKALDGRLLAAAYMVHSGLCRKTLLFTVLHAAVTQGRPAGGAPLEERDLDALRRCLLPVHVLEVNHSHLTPRICN